MKSLALILTCALATAFTASCAQSLEQIVEQHHQARLDASMNNQPLRHGAGDGIGARNAHVPETASATDDSRLSLAVPAAATPEPDSSKNH